MAARSAISTEAAPPPVGTYAQALRVGDVLYVSGQTPRRPSGERLEGEPFEVQARQTLDNLAAVVAAAGASVADAAKVTVFLRDADHRAEFDAVYRDYVGDPPPARTVVVTGDLPFAVEVDAIVAL